LNLYGNVSTGLNRFLKDFDKKHALKFMKDRDEKEETETIQERKEKGMIIIRFRQVHTQLM